MRKRTSAAVSALAAVSLCAAAGCTVQPGDGDGKQAPIRIYWPSETPSGAEKPRPKKSADARATPPPRAAPPRPAPPRPAPKKSPPRKPAPPPAAPSKVLWSRGDTGRDVRELQARLRQAAWLFHGPTGRYDAPTEKAVRGFQAKRGLPRTGSVDAATWQRLVRMTREPGKWELYLMGGQPADTPDPRCRTGRVLCISKSSRTLRWMIDGRTLMTLPVRFGSRGTPTREGIFRVYWKSRHHVSTLYDSPMPYAMFFSGGQAVHYSADFAARGYAGASHGCVNVRDEAAIARLFGQVRKGDKVVVHW
ncbi:L,D-transpeptidase family protein [Streptomyces thermospinosisporus]|uniref:L,D-transpeptidase family protein n=1 Tax=Streptomyces thermospinosisporus TaxID=161482 RepID=UPI0031DDBD80